MAVTFYIKAWPDNRATLMTDLGQILMTFPSVEEAASACREWYAGNRLRTEYEMVTPACLDGTVSLIE